MFKRILTYSLIAVLGIALIGGAVAILVRPNDVEAYGGRGVNLEQNGSHNGNLDSEVRGSGNDQGHGQDQGDGTNGGNQNSGSGGGYGDRGQGNAYTTIPQNWETLTGIVLISDSELTVDTGGTEVLVGLGQSWYREAQGFEVNVGDEVRIDGYEEDGEFKAGMVENLTQGTSLVLRDTSGRPMWSGQNALNSSGSGQSENSGTGNGGGIGRGQGQGQGNGGGNGGGQGQGQGNGGDDGSYIIPETVDSEPLACPICDTAATYDGPLNEVEVNALYLALNDEYHAWAVYEQVISDFGSVRPFSSIQNAEANHIAALTRLFDNYGLTLPENPWIEQVASFESLSAACAAGVQAEVANGGLYDTLLSSTERNDILDVYTSLQRASLEQHLPAFTRCAD